MANEIKPLTQAAPFVAELVAKVNEIAGKMRPLLNLKAGKGMEITQSSSDITLSANAEGGGGLPDGYTFEEFTICDSGTPATRWWPTWTTNPEA